MSEPRFKKIETDKDSLRGFHRLLNNTIPVKFNKKSKNFKILQKTPILVAKMGILYNISIHLGLFFLCYLVIIGVYIIKSFFMATLPKIICVENR